MSQLPYVRQPQEKYPSKPHGFCQRLPIQKTPVPIFPCRQISEQRDRVGDLLKGSCYWSRGLKPTLPCIQRPPPPHPAINTHPATRNHLETERDPAAGGTAELVPSVGILAHSCYNCTTLLGDLTRHLISETCNQYSCHGTILIPDRILTKFSSIILPGNDMSQKEAFPPSHTSFPAFQ